MLANYALRRSIGAAIFSLISVCLSPLSQAEEASDLFSLFSETPAPVSEPGNARVQNPLQLLRKALAQGEVPVAQDARTGKPVFEVLQLGKPLGEGGLGSVVTATVKTPGGSVDTIALKVFHRFDPVLSSYVSESAELLKPVLNSGRDLPIQQERGGLAVQFKDGTALRSLDVVASPVMDGAVAEKIPLLRLAPSAPGFPERVKVLARLMRDSSGAVHLLSQNGLTHNDIKPQNLFFKTEPGFNWNQPDPAKIRFRLADLDFISKEGGRSVASTPAFCPPETFLTKAGIGTTSRDVYSLANTIYATAFGHLPWDDYMNALESRSPGARLSTAAREKREALRFETFSDPKRYAAFLRWIELRFKSLEKLAPDPETRLEIRSLGDFTRQGLAHNPRERAPALDIARASGPPKLARWLQSLGEARGEEFKTDWRLLRSSRWEKSPVLRRAVIENLSHPFSTVKAEAWTALFETKFWQDPELRKLGLFALRTEKDAIGHDPLTRPLKALAWQKLQDLPWNEDPELRALVEDTSRDARSPGYSVAQKMIGGKSACERAFRRLIE